MPQDCRLPGALAADPIVQLEAGDGRGSAVETKDPGGRRRLITHLVEDHGIVRGQPNASARSSNEGNPLSGGCSRIRGFLPFTDSFACEILIGARLVAQKRRQRCGVAVLQIGAGKIRCEIVTLGKGFERAIADVADGVGIRHLALAEVYAHVPCSPSIDLP